MTETARFIQKAERDAGNSRMWGYVFQGRAYEGLTVNALEWLDSFNAGTIVDLDGKITVNNPRAAEALTLAASWINDITPQGVLNYSEEECRGVFQSGNAVFMRNWPYAWPLMNAQDSPVKDRSASPRCRRAERTASRPPPWAAGSLRYPNIRRTRKWRRIWSAT